MATTNATNQPSGNDVAGSAFFKKFLASAENYLKQPHRLKDLLVNAFNKAREKKEIGAIAHEVWDTMQSLFRLIKLSASGEYTGVPTTTVVAAVAVLIYFLSPIDLIPDFVPVVGLLDDMALFAWFTTSIKHELDKFHDWEATRPSATVVTSSEELWRPNATQARSTNQSAKSAGTYNLPEAPTPGGQSATDAGLGSPSSSVDTPIHTQGADVTPGDFNSSDTVGNTTGSSRDGNDGYEATGGNVR